VIFQCTLHTFQVNNQFLPLCQLTIKKWLYKSLFFSQRKYLKIFDSDNWTLISEISFNLLILNLSHYIQNNLLIFILFEFCYYSILKICDLSFFKKGKFTQNQNSKFPFILYFYPFLLIITIFSFSIHHKNLYLNFQI
jgi:hypothetical protein